MNYRHYKGGIYSIICEARLESSPGVVMVVYRSAADGVVWTRPRDEFFELVEHAGGRTPRFAPAA